MIGNGLAWFLAWLFARAAWHKALAPGYYHVIMRRYAGAAGSVLVWPLAHAGLALATSLAPFVNASLLYRGLYRGGVHRPRAGWPALLARTIAACSLMALVLWWLHGDEAFWTSAPALERVQRLLLVVVAGMVTYVAAIVAAGMRPRHLVRIA